MAARKYATLTDIEKVRNEIEKVRLESTQMMAEHEKECNQRWGTIQSSIAGISREVGVSTASSQRNAKVLHAAIFLILTTLVTIIVEMIVLV